MTLPRDTFAQNTRLCLDGRITRESIHPAAAGGNADVYEGLFGCQKVAIKVLRPFGSNGRKMERTRLLRRLWREYLAWCDLSHRNILGFLGYSYDFSPESYILPSLISPWMANGTVNSYLEDHPDADRLSLLVGIAEGLSYLHSREPPVVHGDLRAGNILVSDLGVPCLSDFGLSRILDEARGMTTSSELAGSVPWMSPELLQIDSNVTVHSDVWAYGMTILEILSGKRPYANVKPDVLVHIQIRDGRIPSRPQSPGVLELLDDYMWAVCQRCWSLEPTSRPSMEEVTSMIISAAEEVSDWVAVSRNRNPDCAIHINPGYILENAELSRFGLLTRFEEGAFFRDSLIFLLPRKARSPPTFSLRISPFTRVVRFFCFSVDGKYLAMCGWRTIKIHDTSTGATTCVLYSYDSDALSSVCFHPNGNFLATGDQDGQIRIWDVVNRKIRKILNGHHSLVAALEFSQDGRLLVSASSSDGTAFIWEMEMYHPNCKVIPIYVPSQLSTGVTLAISPDGRLVATSAIDGNVYLWDVRRSILVELLIGHTKMVTSITFSPDGRWLVSGSSNGTIKLWDLAPFLGNPKRNTPLRLLGGTSFGLTKGQGEKGSICVTEFSQHGERLLRVAVSRDGGWVISISVQGCIQFWPLDSALPVGTEELRFEWSPSAGLYPMSVDFSPASGMIATVGGRWDTVRLWNYNVGCSETR